MTHPYPSQPAFHPQAQSAGLMPSQASHSYSPTEHRGPPYSSHPHGPVHRQMPVMHSTVPPMHPTGQTPPQPTHPSTSHPNLPLSGPPPPPIQSQTGYPTSYQYQSPPQPLPPRPPHLYNYPQAPYPQYPPHAYRYQNPYPPYNAAGHMPPARPHAHYPPHISPSGMEHSSSPQQGMSPEESGYSQAPTMAPLPPVMDRCSPFGTIPPMEAVPEPNSQQSLSEVSLDPTTVPTNCSEEPPHR